MSTSSDPDPGRDRGRTGNRDRRHDPGHDLRLARQARLVTYVIAGTMISWMVAQYVGGQMGWEVRFAFLLDLAAVGAFVWALVTTYSIWRQRQD